jgi:uncharacterized protein YceK
MPRGLVLLVAVSLAGCATANPYVGQGPHPQVQRGRPVLLVDALGNVLAIIPKIVLWDWRVADHAISPETESYVVSYLDSHQQQVGGTQVQLNQYAPHHDLARLARNRKIAWPYRLILGLPTTLVFDVLLPGRLFPWGDYYNPWTDTVHLYSDHPAVGLHEIGHSYDINRRRFKGTYAAIRMVPFVDLFQEMQATGEAIDYLRETGDRPQELRSYKILYPAFGTYAGGYMFILGGSLIGAVVGHVFGRVKAHDRAQYYQRLDAAEAATPSETPLDETPVVR